MGGIDARQPEPDEPKTPEECEEVLEHVEDYLNSDRTCADERELRANVAERAPYAQDLGIEELISVLVKRSCCETAPETLRLRIRTQVRIWRSQG